MQTEVNLAAGRLRCVVPEGEMIQVGDGPSSYGVSRLGLVPRVQPAIVAPPQAPPAVKTYKKGTFKVPAQTMAKLKAYASITEQYQYRVVDAAISQFLERVTAMMGYEERGAMARLEQHFLDDEAASVKTPFRPRHTTFQPAGRSSDTEPAATHSAHWWWILRGLAHLRRDG